MEYGMKKEGRKCETTREEKKGKERKNERNQKTNKLEETESRMRCKEKHEKIKRRNWEKEINTGVEGIFKKT